MSSYKETTEKLFGECSSFREVAYDVTAEFTCSAEKLPQYENLVAFVSDIADSDSMMLEMKSVDEFSYNSQDKAVWQQSYEKFVSDCEDDDEIKTTLHITKHFQGDTIGVYCFDAFAEYLSGLSVLGQINFFVALFNGNEEKLRHSQIRFDLRDSDSAFLTKTLHFCSKDIFVPSDGDDRNSSRKKYSTASLFFSQNEFGLTPDDFAIIDDSRNREDENVGSTYEFNSEEEPVRLLKSYFAKLETIFSYAYLAHTCQIVDNNIVLQFDAANSRYVVPLDSVRDNRAICKIFEWAFHCDNVVERASIARNVIAIRCKSQEDLLELSDEVYSSVKSNFNIYQKGSTEKYIETKNKIADLIVESTKQVRDLTHDLVEGLRNNFIAMAMFLLTTLLTDSIDVEDMVQGKSLSYELAFVLDIFVVFSGAYLVVAYISAFFKWRMFKRGYDQLKGNYTGMLDEVDLAEAFSNGDKSVRKTRNSILIAGGIIFAIWIGCLIWLYGSVHQIDLIGHLVRIS